ncbi:hypothetical protein BV22DRAFT_996853, partial [Leucogyrophana mollusca]
LTQIVNSLTSKLEIGAPMASLYLLGHPDHYTSHEFASCHWKSFVYEARKDWHPEEIFDYIYRPEEFEDMSLYDWIRYSVRKPISKTKGKAADDPTADGSNPAEDDDVTDDGAPQQIDTSFFRFLSHHPLHGSHHVRCTYRNGGRVPNLIGGSLPRPDRGDREYYCSTMLTLFRPWRRGRELKGPEQSWDEAFNSYAFGDLAKTVMKNINVKYECLDARDDYSAQRRQEGKGGDHELPAWYPFDAGDGLPHLDDDDMELDCAYPSLDEDRVLETNVLGRLTAKWNYDKSVVERILQCSGWLDPVTTPLDNVEI